MRPMADDPLTTTPTIARARVSIWLSRAAGKALRNDAQVLSYKGEVGLRFLLILITVLAPLIIPDGGVMRTSLCQVTPSKGGTVCADQQIVHLVGVGAESGGCRVDYPAVCADSTGTAQKPVVYHLARNNMDKKIFVTGGNGFVGSRVVQQLLARGYGVRCLLRATSTTHRIDGLAIEHVLGDIRDPTSLVRGMAGCDGVIHLASLSNWSDIHSGLLDAVVVDGSRNVFVAAQVSGNLRTVFVSSIVAINGSDSPVMLHEHSSFTLDDPTAYAYAFAKHHTERAAHQAVAAGLPVVIVNPAEIYGPQDDDLVTSGNLIDFARSNPVFVTNGGTSIVHVDDVAAGIIAAFERGRVGERYILGGENLTIRALAEYTLALLHQTKRIVTMPNGLMRQLAHIGQRWRMPLPFEPAVIPYAVKYWFVDNTKARQELGLTFRPAEETLAPTLAWLQQRGFIPSSTTI